VRTKPTARVWFWLAGWLFPRNSVTETIATSVHFHTSPEVVWQQMLLYEDVPVCPPFLLRMLLPYPVRTEGKKTCVGACVQCTYNGGYLVKRIIVVEQPHLVRFDVIEQDLGIEGCITTLGGSYEIRPCGDDTEVVLTTNYQGHLRPRRFWRPLERILTHQLHHHILDGMRGALLHSVPDAPSALEKRPEPKSIGTQELTCTATHSPSHR
jgi:hypothetical protein